MPRRDAHTPDWIAFLPPGRWERGSLGTAALLLVHASVSLTRTPRDRREAGDAAAARAERVR